MIANARVTFWEELEGFFVKHGTRNFIKIFEVVKILIKFWKKCLAFYMKT